jgi:hypothetical protein
MNGYSALEAVSNLWQGLVGAAVLLGLGAIFRSYLAGILRHLLPTESRLARLIRQRDLPLPAGERFVVLIADLQGDDDRRTHTRHVAAALEPHRGLEVVLLGPGPEWDMGSRDDFEAKGRTLLMQRRGHVLISGDVATPARGLRLRILPSDRDIEAAQGVPEGRRPGEYVLTETGLPLEFDQNFNAVLLAIVAAAVAPTTDRQGHYLADLLLPTVRKLKYLRANIPAGLDQDQRGSICQALGLAVYVLGEQKGENERLEEAVAAFARRLRNGPATATRSGGPRPRITSAACSSGWVRGRVAPNGSNKRWPPTARRSRNAPANASPPTGR